MSAETKTEGKASAAIDDASINHVVCCCNDNLAMCGGDVSGEPWLEVDDIPCPLCHTAEAESSICSRCGGDCSECEL